MKKIWFILIMANILQAQEFYYEYGKKVNLKPISTQRDLNGIKYYQKAEGVKVGVKDEIILKCKDNISCRDSLLKYQFKSIENLSNTLIIVQIEDKEDIFKIAQELYNQDNIEFATPNFTKERKAR
jgi:predicted adenine nucleotide alpha hydrolase (AANH) superfamily ATPase